MEYIRAKLKLTKNISIEYELVPQADFVVKPALPRICRCTTMEVKPLSGDDGSTGYSGLINTDQQRSTIGPSLPAAPADTSEQRDQDRKPVRLDDLLPRFGPIYREENDPMDQVKKTAWRRVYNVSVGDGITTKEDILADIRSVEKEARETYTEGINPAGAPSKFRKMLIKDCCLFLQLALMILGKSQLQLGYIRGDTIVHGNASEEDLSKQWLEAMFFVGNQIPHAVLKILIRQKYFQEIIAKEQIREPPATDLRRQILFKLVIPPKVETVPRKNWWSSLVDQITRAEDDTIEQEPFDVLQALHNIVLGAPSKKDSKFTKYGGASFDLESNTEEGLSDKERIFPSATELEKAGISIKKLKSGGARSIHFSTFFFRGYLHLPVLSVNADTEIIFSLLKRYEMSSKHLGKHNHEVRSYISFMSQLIQTPQDLSLLLGKKLIQGRDDYADKLPGVMRSLNSNDVTFTYKFRDMRRQIRDFSSPWVRYEAIINIAFFLTIVQTFFALLAYFRPP